ncbi:MAG TPA: cytochrome c biogenesis protein CcdA, partial [Chloroflexota bacterium]|nr:cytochrome c biogenesis protein CcdA [Chloroflexota bacterium]
GATEVRADFRRGEARFRAPATVDRPALQEAVRAAGYEPGPVGAVDLVGAARPGHTRTAVGWTAAALALAAAVGGALLTGGPIGGPLLAAATLSGRATGLLRGVGDLLPAGYALGAGMAAAFNPCGFALLPAYLALYVGAESAAAPRLARAAAAGAAMTAGFVALFGLAGLVLAALAAAVAGLLPWLSLAVGVLMVAAGGRLLAGGALPAASAVRLASRFGRRAERQGLIGYAAFGVAFGLSSLGCTLPLFLTVVGTSLTARGALGAASGVALYGLGMGLAVTSLTVAVAVFGRAAARAGRVGRYLEPASAVLLLASGAYVVYYWLSAGGLLV